MKIRMVSAEILIQYMSNEAEDFYRNDYPEDEDYESDDNELDRYYNSEDRKQKYDSEDDFEEPDRERDEPDAWSEDENLEQYRDRILGRLRTEIG
jgi:hypothetical protein